jgi:DNA invertase Pin-like site-specific DNA recombinase
MAKYGYLMRFAGCETADSDLRWMAEFGCKTIVEESSELEKLRPARRKLLTEMQVGDTLVISGLSNVLRSASQLSVFLELCKIKSIRLVSIHDRIDTGGELFTETSAADVLNILAKLPHDISSARKSPGRKREPRVRTSMISKESMDRAQRVRTVIKMYKNHFAIPEIMAASGFKSRDSIFRILNEAGIRLNRTKRDYYAGKNDKKEREE